MRPGASREPLAVLGFEDRAGSRQQIVAPAGALWALWQALPREVRRRLSLCYDDNPAPASDPAALKSPGE